MGVGGGGFDREPGGGGVGAAGGYWPKRDCARERGRGAARHGMFGGLDSPEPTRARAMVFARVSERAATASSSRRDERRDPVVGFGFNEWRRRG